MKKITALILCAALGCSTLFAETQVYSFLPSQIKNIDVNFAAGNITVKTEETDHINITVNKEIDVSAPTVKLNENTLSIRTKIFASFKKEQDIEISVPKGMKLGDVKFVCPNANSYVENIDINNLTITTAAGLIKIKNSTISGDAKLAGASGKISAKNSKITNLDCSAVNADISIEECISGNAKMETMNGKIQLLDAVTESFEAKSSAGAITIQFKEMATKNSSVKTKNGAIDISVPKDTGYNAVVSTLNGQFIDNNTYVTAAQCDSLVSNYKNGTIDLKLESTSGKITINSF